VALSVMLTPVLIIFLCDLSRELRATVIVVFILACIAMMVVMMEELTEHEFFLCIVAYVFLRSC
jgi:hypothetical protein